MTDTELAIALRTVSNKLCCEAADRIEKLGEQLTEAIGFWERHRATLDTIKAALDTYDKDPHPADPHVLFAFVEAVAGAVRR